MSAKTVKNVSPATELETVKNLYTNFIAIGEDANSSALNFILDLANEMQLGATQEDVIFTMKAVAKGHNRPAVTASHVPSIKTASKIITAYMDADIQDAKASKVLSVAVRVLAEAKASGVDNHIANFPTFAELDKGTATKAESQADAKAESQDEQMQESAKAITLENIVDAVDSYLSANDLKTLTTSELEKLHKVIAKLITVENNTKALVK